jgi:Fur family ferric uptake transcriptional regulator
MIIEAVAHSGRHVSAEEVFAVVQARARAVNIATVYRTLDLLVEEGLVSRTDLRSGHVVYASAEHGSHIHLVCRLCGCVIDANVGSFESLFEQVESNYDFTCGPQHLAVYGLCGGCRNDASVDTVVLEV